VYDITNAVSFRKVRGWLEGLSFRSDTLVQSGGLTVRPSADPGVHAELKMNCLPGLVICVVGTKADLSDQRQVTFEFARSSLREWFSPPKLSRFPTFSIPSRSNSFFDVNFTRDSVLKMRDPRPGLSVSMEHQNSYGDIVRARPTQRSFVISPANTESVDDGPVENEWGWEGELFEVSAKDNTGEFASPHYPTSPAADVSLCSPGLTELFDSFFKAIVGWKDRQNETMKRNGVSLSPTSPLTDSADEPEEEGTVGRMARAKLRSKARNTVGGRAKAKFRAKDQSPH
jgi:hypothetical protein